MTTRDILNLKNSVLGFAQQKNGDERPAALYDTGSQIELSTLGHDNGGALQRFAKAPTGENHDSGTEEEFGLCIAFKADYPYTLIECGRSPYRVSSGISTTTILPEYVVAGIARTDLGTIDGMLTSIDGLSQWLGLSRFRWESEDLRQTITVEDTPETTMGLSDSLNYSQKWFIHPHCDSVVMTNHVYLKTFLPNKSWAKHLRIHDLISELMSVADCHTHTYRDMKVYKAEPSIKPSGEINRNDWHDVLSYNPAIEREAIDRETEFLFTYSDLFPEGVAKWDELRSECSQGMTILLYLIRDFDNLAIETQAVLVGIMLEYIGRYIDASKKFKQYVDMDAAGAEESNNEPETGFRRLMTLLLGCFENNVPLTKPDEWKDRMRRAYMGSKHPDAKKATLDEMYLAVMESMVLVRMWVGMQAGADPKKMKSRLSCDKNGRLIQSHLA